MRLMFRDDIGEMESFSSQSVGRQSGQFRDDIGEMESSTLTSLSSCQYSFRDDIGEMERRARLVNWA